MSAGGGEMRGFVFAVIFIIVFSSFVASIPAGLKGTIDGTVETVIPVDPSLLTDFADSEDFTRTDFVPPSASGIYWYPADLNGEYFYCGYISSAFGFVVAAKLLFFGLWFGALKAVDFKYANGTTDDGGLSFDDLEATNDDGAVRFTLVFEADGSPAGGFLFYWNTTTYGNDPESAWDADELYLLHGIGIGTSATHDIGALLIGLLFLQLPDVPVIVNVFLATPLWACIIFVLWFVIKEMIPFV